MVSDAGLAGAAQAEPSAVADQGPAALVFVVGGDVADGGVQAHAFVERAHSAGGTMGHELLGCGDPSGRALP